MCIFFFFFSSRRRHTRYWRDWSSDVCSSDLVSAGMAFVHAPWLFYVMRFLLVVFEAGFFPGIILYFTYWYPGAYRARIIAIFMSGIAVAGVLGGPISGWIMNDMAGVWGLKGWQWMFILEGLPTPFLGLYVFFYLDDKPEEARSEEHTSELQSRQYLVCRLLLEKKKQTHNIAYNIQHI